METATAITKNEIKQAMDMLGLENWVDGLMDEIELSRRLNHSAKQADRGETLAIEQLKKQVEEKFKIGYYE